MSAAAPLPSIDIKVTSTSRQRLTYERALHLLKSVELRRYPWEIRLSVEYGFDSFYIRAEAMVPEREGGA